MKAKQFAWTHVITEGRMNMHPSYYGGWEYLDRKKEYCIDKDLKAGRKTELDSFLAKIKTVGVNWDKTDDIQSETYSEFNGTFDDPSDETYLEGWMTLNDGTRAFWCAPNIEASTIFRQFELHDEMVEKYKQIFEKD